MPLFSTLLLASFAPAPVQDRREFLDDPPAPRAARADAAARSGGGSVQRGSYVSVQVNVDALGQNIVGDAANEPSLAVDPADPSNLVVGWRQFDSVASNFRQAGYAYSFDGGASWTFPGVLEPGIFRSDPVLAADNAGRIFYQSLTQDAQGNILVDVFRSLDGGVTWGSAVPSFGGDKNWMTVDRSGGIGDGHLYGSWQVSFACCGNDTATRSTNGGLSFEAPFQPGSPIPVFGTMDVGPGGSLHLAGVEGSFFGVDLSSFVHSRSDDAQDAAVSPPTFTTSAVPLGGNLVVSAGSSSPNPGGLIGQVDVAVDASGGPLDGNVYVLASVDPPGGGPNVTDLSIVRSEDGGQTWSAPVLVNDDRDPGNLNWQWFGTLSVAPNGRIDVAWNDTRASGLGNVSELYYAYSYDGGRTWSENVAASPPFDSHLGWPNQDKMGDYIHIESDATGANLAYTATFNGEQDVWFARLFPDCNGNGVSDVADLAAGSTDFDGNGFPDECDPLHVDVDTISLAAGGTQGMTLDAGAENALQLYWILGSSTGTAPGIPVPPFTLPLNQDAYTQFTLLNPNTLVAGSLDFLDSAGQETASLTLPAGLGGGLAGLTLHHAYLVIDVVSFGARFVSNAVPLNLAP